MIVSKILYCNKCNKKTVHNVRRQYYICKECNKRIKIQQKKYGPLIMSSYVDDLGIKFGPYIKNKEME